MVTISLCVMAGEYNVGDEGILLAKYKMLMEYGRRVDKINLFCANIKRAKKRYSFIDDGVDLFDFYKKGNLKITIKLLRETDYLYFGGGCMLTHDHRYSLFLLLAHILGVPIIITAVGTLPQYNEKKTLKQRLRLGLSRLALRQAWAISVRDEETKYLTEKLIGKSCHVVDDDIYELTAPKKRQYRKPLQHRKHVKILVNVKPYGHLNEEDNILQYHKVMRRINQISKLHDTVQLDVVRFSDGDRPIYMNHSNVKVRHLKWEPKPYEFLEKVKEYDFVLAMRKHVAMLAYMSGVKFMATDGDDGMYWQLKKIGQERCLI